VRVTIPRVIAGTFGMALAGYVFVVAPGLPGSVARNVAGIAGHGSARTSRPPGRGHSVATPFPLRGKQFIGIMTTGGPYNFTDLDSFTAAVKHRPEVYEFSQGWALNQFNRGVIEGVARRGMLPMISWEPWNYRRESRSDALRGYQPAYRLSNIIDGRYDKYITSWAEGVKGLGFTIAIRFAHEMNGYWYPWCVLANGNTIGQYVRAWRHVHDIFRKAGATNVIWVWSPNVVWNGSVDLAKLYPGNAYVNWIGLSGYYGTPGMFSYEDFDTIFDRTIAELRTFTRKPLVITETGATNTSGLMARYIIQMFRELPAHTSIIGVIWYEGFNVVDWRVSDHPAAAAAFAGGFAKQRYQMSWLPGMVPLLTVSRSPRSGGRAAGRR
jgi:mannan endo-1,4-beta-mannosidase